MIDSAFGDHLKKVRVEVIGILQDVHPKAIVPEIIFTRSKRARNMDEIRGVLMVLVKQGTAKMPSPNVAGYRLSDDYAASGAGSEEDEPVDQVPVSERVNGKAGKRGSYKPRRDRGRSPLSNALHQYLVDHGPKTSSELKNADLGMSNVYEVLGQLQKAGRARCIVSGGRKVWHAVPSGEEVEPEPEPRPEITAIDPTRALAFEELPASTTVQTAGELMPESEFRMQATKGRIWNIVDAIDARAKAGEAIPPEWSGELKRRLSSGFE